MDKLLCSRNDMDDLILEYELKELYPNTKTFYLYHDGIKIDCLLFGKRYS